MKQKQRLIEAINSMTKEELEIIVSSFSDDEVFYFINRVNQFKFKLGETVMFKTDDEAAPEEGVVIDYIDGSFPYRIQLAERIVWCGGANLYYPVPTGLQVGSKVTVKNKPGWGVIDKINSAIDDYHLSQAYGGLCPGWYSGIYLTTIEDMPKIGIGDKVVYRTKEGVGVGTIMDESPTDDDVMVSFSSGVLIVSKNDLKAAPTSRPRIKDKDKTSQL
jgi:hypothetical protein